MGRLLVSYFLYKRDFMCRNNFKQTLKYPQLKLKWRRNRNSSAQISFTEESDSAELNPK